MNMRRHHQVAIVANGGISSIDIINIFVICNFEVMIAKLMEIVLILIYYNYKTELLGIYFKFKPNRRTSAVKRNISNLL